ncbi:MAG: DUF4190 domain-containing protein [Lachnospiraceae bacterium]|nr:DUF4190 domain-containing protein [Lachnospiraceae bacterium]
MPDYNDEYMYENPSYRNKNPMATAALVLGILSITCCSIIYVSLPFGAIAVICAILSRGNGRMSGKSKAGIICGIVGLIATVAITVSSFYYVLTTEEGREYLQYYYRVYSGDYDFDINNALEEMFPFLYGSGNSTDGSDDSGSGGSGSGGSGSENGLGGFGSGDSGSENGLGGFGNSEGEEASGGFGEPGQDGGSQEYGGFENELPGDGFENENPGSDGSDGSGGGDSGGNSGSDNSSGQNDGGFI